MNALDDTIYQIYQNGGTHGKPEDEMSMRLTPQESKAFRTAFRQIRAELFYFSDSEQWSESRLCGAEAEPI